jgi:hypothetical protein
MRIELNIVDRAKQQVWLDHFNAALRQALVDGGSGSAGVDHDGLFRSTFAGEFPVGDRKVLLTWRITKSREGTLTDLEVSGPTPAADVVEWERVVERFVTSVSLAAFTEKRGTHFHRALFYYIGPHLDGEYWLAGYRVGPVLVDDNDPSATYVERVLAIDMEVVAVDRMHARAIGDEMARRHAARLSLLANIGLYRGSSLQFRWVAPDLKSEGNQWSRRQRLDFVHPNVDLSAMPAKGQLCELGGYTTTLAALYRTGGTLLSLPREARRVLRGIERAGATIVDAFDRCARLYQVAMVAGRQFPSVDLAYRVAAVDAIAQTARFSGFSDFVRQHVAPRENTEAALEYLYRSVRSAHFHGGEFPMGEFARGFVFDPLMDEDRASMSDLRQVGYALTREAIVTWLTRMLPNLPSDGEGAE